MSAEDDFDYWTQEPNAAEKSPKPSLQVETIDCVEPLDAQFGVAEPLTVPLALQDILFGQPGPGEDGLARAEGDTGKIPPLHTYAILDAAKVINLPEMLDTSGLEYRCLFKGKALDELKGVAPWIVRLEEGNSFTRNLFTRSDAPWHLWDKEPGIYVRSRGTLDEMWKHFRKFTKIQDEAGKWHYFRFWESGLFSFVCRNQQNSMAVLKRFFHSLSRSVIAISSGQATMVIGQNKQLDSNEPIRLDQPILKVFADYIERLNILEITRVHEKGHRREFAFKGSDNILANNFYLAQKSQELGAKTKIEITSVCYLGLWLGREFLSDPLHHWATQGLQENGPMARMIYWKERIYLYFDEVLGGNSEILARAAQKSFQRMDAYVGPQAAIAFTPEAFLNIANFVYPEKVQFCGQSAVIRLAEIIQNEPRIKTPQARFFTAFCCLFFGIGFLIDPMSPFYGDDIAANGNTELHDKAKRFLKLRGKVQKLENT